MTSDQYCQTLQELEAAGLGNPDGRIYHVAAPKEGGWFVTDVWESEEHFGKFSDGLIPVLQAAGVTLAEPQTQHLIKKAQFRQTEAFFFCFLELDQCLYAPKVERKR